MNDIAQRFDERFELTIETPAALTTADEISLLRAALARNPSAPALRLKLAGALAQMDAFDESIEILQTLADEAPDFEVHYSLGLAHLSRETAAGDALALDHAMIAQRLATAPFERAAALAVEGKALARGGQVDAARTQLHAALAEFPGDKDAFKRLAALDMDSGHPERVIALSDSLLDQGVCHARLLAGRVIALAKQGRIDDARTAASLDRLLCRQTIAPPDGMTLEDFNAAIRDELHANRGLRFDRYGTASSKTWRLDQPATAASVMVRRLQTVIREAVLNYVATIADHDHPWVAHAPARGQLHNWCVMTDAEGFETWHVHQFGWISGVYYVDVPESITNGDDKGGCIAFGLPDDVVGDTAAAAFGELLVRPTPGLLMLFPSHTYHRTFAHGADARRICLAFDIHPL